MVNCRPSKSTGESYSTNVFHRLERLSRVIGTVVLRCHRLSVLLMSLIGVPVVARRMYTSGRGTADEVWTKKTYFFGGLKRVPKNKKTEVRLKKLGDRSKRHRHICIYIYMINYRQHSRRALCGLIPRSHAPAHAPDETGKSSASTPPTQTPCIFSGSCCTKTGRRIRPSHTSKKLSTAQPTTPTRTSTTALGNA